MKIEFARLEIIEKIFKEGSKQATEENVLETWENTIGKIFDITCGKDFLHFWKRISSSQKQAITSDTWHSLNHFQNLISKKKSD